MALGWLGDFLGINKGNATVAAADANRGVIGNYDTRASGIIDNGANRAQGLLGDALDLTGLRGSTLYADALGANGAEGSARALDAYTVSPGYQFQLDQGQQALDRRAAMTGRLSSGNSDLDALKYSQGLASQDWNQWLGNLTGGVDRTTGLLRDKSGLATDTANARLGVAGDVASGYTDANNMMAGGQEANQGWGMDLLKNIVGIGGSIAGFGKAGFGGGGYSPGFGGYGSF